MAADGATLNGRYKLLERAGTGGMATVYKAHDLTLRRLVAVKILHESLLGDESFLRRFQHEALAAANLSHPNIVTVHDIGQDEHRQYIVMEYVNGQTLKDLIRQCMQENGEPLSVEQTLDLCIQICAGIGYAHRAGLVHCDVKPQNVLVTRDGRVKVADFGIARAMSRTSLQTSSLLWGTPHYFAPEQAAGEPASPASDVYAIGIMMFESLSGRLPFEAESLPALVLKHLHEIPPPVTDFNAGVPVQLEQIIQKILSKEPAGRYRTAGQLERILRSYRDSSQQDTGPILPIRSVPRPVKVSSPPPPRPTAEAKTEVFQRVAAPAVGRDGNNNNHVQNRMRRPLALATRQEEPESRFHYLQTYRDDSSTTDWTAVILGVIALVAMLGLIPLWYFVARAWGVL